MCVMWVNINIMWSMYIKYKCKGDVYVYVYVYVMWIYKYVCM